MNIFESLENLNVSEECFNDILSIVEDLVPELKAQRRHSTKMSGRAWKELRNSRKAHTNSQVNLMRSRLNSILDINPETIPNSVKKAAQAEKDEENARDRMNQAEVDYQGWKRREQNLRNQVDDLTMP